MFAKELIIIYKCNVRFSGVIQLSIGYSIQLNKKSIYQLYMIHIMPSIYILLTWETRIFIVKPEPNQDNRNTKIIKKTI